MTDEELLSTAVRLPDHVVYRSFPAETVVLNLNTGLYHGLNPTAGRMLEAFEGADDVAAAVTQIAEVYGEPVDRVRRDGLDLCRALLERELVELDGVAAASKDS